MHLKIGLNIGQYLTHIMGQYRKKYRCNQRKMTDTLCINPEHTRCP